MKFERTAVYNIGNAMHGMRNPKESWNRNDTLGEVIGDNDMVLAQTLIKAGPEHSKFMRQIFVTVDITAPLFWWKEADQYKVGTVTDSTSTMHKLMSKPFTPDLFEFDSVEKEMAGSICEHLEYWRQRYLGEADQTVKKQLWRAIVEVLPEGWMQMRTWSGDYAVLRNMYFQRKNHKLKEWSDDFVGWIRTLPYAEQLIMLEGSHTEQKIG